jgi:hypothetical protein
MPNASNNLRVKDYGGGLLTTSRKTCWNISQSAPKCPEDLPFVARDSQDRMVWWNVTPPKTDYWHAHEILGRAYAFDLLDLINNPNAEYPPHILAYVTCAIQRWSAGVPAGVAEGMMHGFFGVLSEYISTGTADR